MSLTPESKAEIADQEKTMASYDQNSKRINEIRNAVEGWLIEYEAMYLEGGKYSEFMTEQEISSISQAFCDMKEHLESDSEEEETYKKKYFSMIRIAQLYKRRHDEWNNQALYFPQFKKEICEYRRLLLQYQESEGI